MDEEQLKQNLMQYAKQKLERYRSFGLESKIIMTKQRIDGWLEAYGDKCYVRMTLSPESLVLLHLANKAANKNVTASFSDIEGGRPILSWMASEENKELVDWFMTGCNAFDAETPESRPMAFWTKEDVFAYLKEYGNG